MTIEETANATKVLATHGAIREAIYATLTESRSLLPEGIRVVLDALPGTSGVPEPSVILTLLGDVNADLLNALRFRLANRIATTEAWVFVERRPYA